MTLKKKNKAQEALEKHRAAHAWGADWTQADYKHHESELLQIHKEYQQCLTQWREDRKNFHPDILWQIKQGSYSPSGAVRWSDVRFKNNEWQYFEINNFKLEKYFYWLEFNMTEEEKMAERDKSLKISAEIRILLKKIMNKAHAA